MADNALTVKDYQGNTVQLASKDTGTGQAMLHRVTDGAGNYMPTGDAVGRAILHEITDGTNIATVKAASTAAALTDKSLVVSVNPSCGLSKGNARNLNATVVAVKASAGVLYALTICNAQAAVAFVQVFDVASGSVTLATTNPDFEISVPASSTVVYTFPDGIPFSTAISIASTTGEKGSSGSAAGVMAFFQYA